MKTEPIDNGFILISEKDAKSLNMGKLPPYGSESLIAWNCQHYWLARTVYQGKQRWSIRETEWELVNGQAVLRGKKRSCTN